MKTRGRRFRGLRAVLGFTAIGMTLCPMARADELADTAAARVLGTDGVMLADAGKCDQAIEKLVRAEKLHHAQTTAARLGECEIDVGKIVEGTERLQHVVREPVAANAPPVFALAVARAKQVLEKALPRIAMLRISVKAPAAARVVVTVDGEPLPEPLLDNDRPTDPGTHKLEATAPGFLTSSMDASLGEGEAKAVVIELAPDPNARVANATTSSVPVGASPSAGSGSKAPAIVSFGIGLLGLGIGAGAGAIVAGKASSLATSCGASKVCPQERQAQISSAKSWATVSTTSFIIGGGAIATGVLLLLIDRPSSAATATGARVHPVLGATYAGLDGAF